MNPEFLFEQCHNWKSGGYLTPHLCDKGCNLVHLGVRSLFTRTPLALFPCRVVLSVGPVENVLDQTSCVVPSAPFFHVSQGTQMRAENASVFSSEIVAFVLGVAVQQVMELWDAKDLLGKCCNPADQEH